MQEDQSEQELIAKAQVGAPDAFESLVRRYQEFIVNFVFRITNDKDAALDQSQEVFVKAFRSLKSFEGRSSFRTWLASIALNTTRTYLRRKSNQPNSSLVGNEQDHDAPTPEDTLQKNEKIKKVRRAVMNLKTEHQEVVRLCAIEGFSYSEASEILHIPLGTVCSRMNTALSELRTILSKEVGDE